MGKKMGSAADYIIPLGILAGLGIGAYLLYQKFFGSGSGSGSGLPGLLSSGTTPTATTPGTNPGALYPSSSNATTQQATAISSTQLEAFYGAQDPATNPFGVNLYDANPNCPSISLVQATSLWADIQLAAQGSGFMALFGKAADFSPVLAEFQILVQSACDISLVSTLCMNDKGIDLGTYLFNTFSNDQVGTSGQTNQTMLSQFIYWGFSLPTGLD